MKRNSILSLMSFFIVLSVTQLEAQVVKIRQINLQHFPQIVLTVSIESSLGAPLPVDYRKLQLFEEGKQIKNIGTTSISSVQAPIFSVITLDRSGSMKGKAIEQARQGAAQYIAMMDSADQTAVIVFDTQVEVVSSFSADKNALASMIHSTRTGSDTALLDAVYQGVELARNVPAGAARVLLVLTDGRENRSRHSLAEVIAAARSAGVSIYTIGLGTEIDEAMLTRIANDSEANYYAVSSPAELGNVYKRISQLLHAQLEIVFASPFAMDNLWHTLKIEIPYMDKTISGEKKYLSALESRISSKLMLKMVEAENKMIATQAAAENNPRQAEQERSIQRKTILLLTAMLVLLLVLLTVVLAKKKK